MQGLMVMLVIVVLIVVGLDLHCFQWMDIPLKVCFLFYLILTSINDTTKDERFFHSFDNIYRV